jgi:hypothetical protein
MAQWREGRQVQQVCQHKQAKERTMKSKVRLCLIAMAGCAICAAAGALVIQSGTALAAKGGNDGGGGGGGTQPLEVTGCVTFREGDSDAVLGDGAGPYCDAEITLMVDKWGVKPDWHRFDLHPYNKRDLRLDFSSEKSWYEEAHDPPFQTGWVTLGEFSATEFVPRPDLLDMVPGDTAVLRMVMTTRDPASRKRYFIYFGDTVNDNVWSGSNSITVTAGPLNGDGVVGSWTFESTGAGSLVFVDKGNGSTDARKGVFNLPFAATFSRD